MNCFIVYIRVYNLEFRKYILGSREDYTNEQINNIIESYKKDIKEKLDAMGYINE